MDTSSVTYVVENGSIPTFVTILTVSQSSMIPMYNAVVVLVSAVMAVRSVVTIVEIFVRNVAVRVAVSLAVNE